MTDSVSVFFFSLSDFLLRLHALVIDPSHGALRVARTSRWFVSDSDFSGDVTNPARLLVLFGGKNGRLSLSTRPDKANILNTAL